MDFTFEHSHFAMDSRESIRAMKDLDFLHAELVEIVINELKAGNVISRVQLFGDNQLEVLLRDPFHRTYESPSIQHSIETDPHYRGDFYRMDNHAVVAAVSQS
jgi:hypothetical protein